MGPPLPLIPDTTVPARKGRDLHFLSRPYPRSTARIAESPCAGDASFRPQSPRWSQVAGCSATTGGPVVVALDLIGYIIGGRLPGRDEPAHRKAARLGVGMRDSAVAAVWSSRSAFPTRAASPALLYGIVETATAAWSARAR